MKCITFNTGTYRKAFNSGGCKDKQRNIRCYNGFIKDQENKKFKYWFKYKFKNQYIYLPLQINNNYHNFNLIKQGQYFVKINIIGIKDIEDYVFKNFENIEGMDLNVKHNIMNLLEENRI